MRYASAYRVSDHDDRGCCDRSSFLIINSAGYYEFDESYGATHRQLGRKDYYLSYNHQGTMKVGMGQNHHLIREGTVFLYRPFEEQYYGQADRDPISNYWVHFTGYGASELLVNAGLSDQTLITTGVNQELPALFEALILEISNKKPGFELLSSSLLIHLVSLIARKMDNHCTGRRTETENKLQETMTYIHQNYQQKITVMELASRASLSVSRYSSAFREMNGLSPQQYMVNFRLEKACELMRHTNLNIRQVAALSGFGDQLYFSKLFKKYKSITPTDYVNHMKG